MLATSYLRLLPTLTLHDADVSKLLLSSQNASKFYLQYFQNCEVILNEHSVEILADDKITTFVNDNPDRSIACLALFVTSLRFSINILDLNEFFVLLGSAKRLTSFVADGNRDSGPRRAEAHNASNFLAYHSLPELKTVAGPTKLFCPSKTRKKKLNCCNTVIYTNPHRGSMSSFVRSIIEPIFYAKKMIWNFNACTAIAVISCLNRVTEPRYDVEELTIELKRHTTKVVGTLAEAVLRTFPKLKRLDCYFALSFIDEIDQLSNQPSKNPVDTALTYTMFLDDATQELLKVQTPPHTVLNFYCHVDYAFKVKNDDCFFLLEAVMHNRPNFTFDKIFELRKKRYEPDVTNFKFENVNKQIAENKTFDLRFRGKLVRYHWYYSPWQSPK